MTHSPVSRPLYVGKPLVYRSPHRNGWVLAYPTGIFRWFATWTDAVTSAIRWKIHYDTSIATSARDTRSATETLNLHWPRGFYATVPPPSR